MADNREALIRLQLDLSPNQPRLLEGLDTWLSLGLLTDAQVRHLCQTHLACEVTFQAAIAPVPPTPGPSSTHPRPPITDFLPPEPGPPQPSRNRQGQPLAGPGRASTAAVPPGRAHSPFSRWSQRLMSELSVVWLLGLGVFLVVLSSAVLAATQWARFDALGQYLVLLAYTLVFWGAGGWCRRNPHLQLTAKTLQMITLLLLPLNVWAIDGLGVWSAPGGWFMGLGAVALLTLAALQVLQQRQSSGLERLNVLGLAYLHGGWALGWMPLVAIYSGAVGSAAVTLYRHPARRGRWTRLTVIFSLGLLLIRGLAVTSPDQLGALSLAFGLYGATWVYLGHKDLALAASPPRPPRSRSVANPRWVIAVGRGLLLWGWILAMGSEAYGQGFAVSLLGLGLRLQALQGWGKRRDLLVAYSVAVQLGFVGWQLIPPSVRQGLLLPLRTGFNVTGDAAVLVGLSLFPYVVVLVALGDRYLRRGETKLGRFSDAMALGTNGLLTLISLANGAVLVVNLIASTVTALVVTRRRSPVARWRILGTYGLGVLAILAAVAQAWPQLPLERWMGVMFGLAVLGLLLSKGLPQGWGKGAWLYGVGLSALAYALLGAHLMGHNFQSDLSWLGLVIPVVLVWVGPPPASLLALAVALPLTLGLPWTRLVGLGTATVVTGVTSAAYRRDWVPFLTVGAALGMMVSAIADWLPGFPRQGADWSAVGVGLLALLVLTWRLLAPGSAPPSLAADYRRACDRWGYALTLGWLGAMTLGASGPYLGWRSPLEVLVLSSLGFLGVLGWRYWGQGQPWAIYLAGWGSQLLLTEVWAWRDPTAVTLAVPTLGLGGLALGLGVVLQRRLRPRPEGRSQPDLVSALYALTLGYAGLALMLRLYISTPWTGWVVVAAALLGLEVGRRQGLTGLRWLALVGLSAGWFELVLYPLLRAPGGAVADGLMVLAGVATLIMAVYRLGAGRLEPLGVPSRELRWAAHLHWGIASGLLLSAGVLTELAGARLGGLGLAIAALLVVYALLQGRLGPATEIQQAWVYAGLLELVGWFILARLLFPGLASLDSWWGVVACALAVPLYWLPWATHGWPSRPWQVMAVGTPLAIASFTAGLSHIPTLWVLVGFYGWVAWHSRRIRVSYLSVACALQASWIGLNTLGTRDPLAFVLPVGLALLYLAQVDPQCASSEDSTKGKANRHGLRLVASALILFTALGSPYWGGLAVGAMGLTAIAAGLVFRIRAFLYTGTLVFALNALNQLIVLNATYPLMKWVVGIVVGVALIWIAADFERRRDQWLQLTQTWSQDLDDWQ
jgi:hypothetical protein